MTDTVTDARLEQDAPEESRENLLAAVLRGAGWPFIWLGLLTVGFVAHQVFLTTWLAQQAQGELTAERLEYFNEVEGQLVIVDETGTPIVDVDTGTLIVEVDTGEPIPVDPVDVPVVVDGEGPTLTASSPDPLSTAPLEMILEAPPPRHRACAVIRIPSIDRLKDGWNVVEGVELRDLRTGAGHMPWTPLPGQLGNSVISGHRTTHGAPFHELDELEPGDSIEVETATGVHVYAVRDIIVVKPSALWVTNPREGAWLTLTTCHPKFSARRRLIVFAELVGGPNFAAVERLTS